MVSNTTRNKLNKSLKNFIITALTVITTTTLFSCGGKSPEENFVAGKDSLEVGNHIAAIDLLEPIIKKTERQAWN